MHAAQLPGNAGHRVDIGERAPERLRVAGHDQQVVVGGGVDGVVGKGLAERAQHRGDEARVDLVQLEPLHEHSARIEMAAREPIELAGEQARDAAHPGIGRLRNDNVVLAVVS